MGVCFYRTANNRLSFTIPSTFVFLLKFFCGVMSGNALDCKILTDADHSRLILWETRWERMYSTKLQIEFFEIY
jgi:hypothetical protein